MTVKTKYIVISIIILAFAGVGGGTYFFYIAKNDIKVQQQSVSQENSSVSTQDKTAIKNTQGELTREDIISQNWPFTYIEFDGYWVSSDRQYVTVKKMTRPGDRSGPVVYTQEINKLYEGEKEITALAFDGDTKKLYALTTHTGRGDPLRGQWSVYETDTANNLTQKIFSGKDIVTTTFRFPPNHASLSFMSYNTDQYTDTITQRYFHIINLTDSKKSVTFERPGNVDQYVREHESEFTPQLANTIESVIGAYRFVDSTIEFTSYYATGSEAKGYTQVSDKELWSYDRKNGKMTLLKTIPLKH